jgi:hypothetical protein
LDTAVVSCAKTDPVETVKKQAVVNRHTVFVSQPSLLTIQPP